MLVASILMSLAAQAVPSPPAAPPSTPAAKVEAENEPRLGTALQLIRDRQPQQALAVIDTALTAYDADHATEKRRLYCGMSPPETLLYLTMAARDKVDAVAVAPGYCTALYLKGYT